MSGRTRHGSRVMDDEYYPFDKVVDWSAVERQWRKGPANDRVVDGHGRSILCLSVLGEKVVTGSADHGLKEFNMRNGEPIRELFSPKYGHREWVTCCDYLSDGRVLSGAMDSNLCLWHQSAVRCDTLTGHELSISSLRVDENDMAMSASYDRTLRLWDLNRCREVEVFRGHGKAVFTFSWKNRFLASGCRDGLVCSWDVDTGKLLRKWRGHRQPVQCIEVLSGGSGGDDAQLVASGSWDGEVRVIDLRSKEVVFAEELHPKSHVNAIGVIGPSRGYDMESFDKSRVHYMPNARGFITGGSDGVLRIVDIQGGFLVREELTGHRDAIGTISMRGDLCLSGAANGWVLVHDVNSGDCLYGIGACKEAVRCLEALPERAIVGGDDGNLMILDYIQ
eukprot:TRINITY_DN82279_c0_g1_i1.p1 TRINITY_DN82279_c0_g1~~TRINITY_DN82279_c0_g1_i1.p1  ORF type:complete len:392 (-),score=95.82 TRINITY_DN82279_c0_g1_i1:28-1203(-)